MTLSALSFLNKLKLPLSTPLQVIIWVHGTRTHDIFPPTHVVKKEKTQQNSQEPQKPITYSPHGLHNLLDVDPDLHVSAIARAMYESNKTIYDNNHIYLFGWSGDFTPEARATAATHLYQELENLTILYAQHYGTCPPLVLVTHSHGGNVALECAAIHNGQVIIEKLVLLACPVQEKTKPYTQSPLFKKIYSIHSDKDYFQILDMQGFHPVWQAFEAALKSSSLEPIKQIWRSHNRSAKILSERHFPHQSNLKQACIEWKKDSMRWSIKDLCIIEPFLSEKSIHKLQANLQSYDCKERGLMHIEFLFPTFLQQLSYIMQKLDMSYTEISTDTERPTIIIKI